MTIKEFIAWLDGYNAGLRGTENQAASERLIKEKAVTISDPDGALSRMEQIWNEIHTPEAS